MIDFIAHILPEADHGCTSSAEAEAQLRLLSEAGVNAVVAAPHFDGRCMTPQGFLTARARGERLLADIPRPEGMTVYAGAAIALTGGMHTLPGIADLTVAGTDLLLVELPPEEWNEAMLDTVLGFRSLGLRPVLAHVDRYPARDIEGLFDLGLRGQVNADAFLGIRWLKKFRLRRWIDRGWVVALGSDLHGTVRRTARALRKSAAFLGGERIAKLDAALTELMHGAERI